MHVEQITTWDELAALEHEWNALAGGMPFRSWDWLATWWKHYGSVVRRESDCENTQSTDRQLYVLAVFADSESTTTNEERRLIGIAPWYLDRTRIKGNLLRWLGSGEVCTDHLSLICRLEDTEAVAGAIAESLTTRFDDWDRIDLSAVDADDVAIEKLLSMLGIARLFGFAPTRRFVLGAGIAGNLGRVSGRHLQVASQATETARTTRP